MHPFDSIRILDLTQILAGPYCTYQLGLLGAEVIKVERPGQGDWVRTTGVDPTLATEGMGTHFLSQNAGKKSVTVDMRHEKGLEIIQKLILTSDVFVENFRPGAADRLGLSYQNVQKLKSDIIYCSLSAYGQDGPFSDRKGYDHVLQGTTGVMSLTGTPESGPTKAGLPFVDYATGLNGAFAISAALFERQKTGKGQHLDVAMMDSTLLMMSNIITDYMTTGLEPGLFGNEAQSQSATAALFEANDRKILIAANSDLQFRALMQALGCEKVANDQKYINHQSRLKNKEELRNIVNNALKSKNGEEWEKILESADVPAGLIRNIPEVMMDAGQAMARGISQRMTLAGNNREVSVPTLGFKVNGDVIAARTPPPELGIDTEKILVEVGYNQIEISALKKFGVI